jgi:hypothetical protein
LRVHELIRQPHSSSRSDQSPWLLEFPSDG